MSEALPSEKDALKFFHAFLSEMISIGGKNLPRSIAIHLGGKLAQLYKEREIVNLPQAIMKMSETIGGKTKVERISDDEYYIRTKHSLRFCPIGGRYAPDKGSNFLEIVCLPYIIGFLNEFCPNYETQIEVIGCIIQHGGRSCAYRLVIKPKKDGEKEFF